MLKRTHNCGQLRLEDAGKKVTLAGWVHSYRDHGNLVFIDLRDKEGLTQLVFNPETQPEAHKLARTVRCEWVIAAKGVVQPRGEGLENPKLPTGQIEVAVQQMEILNTSKTPPFEIEDADKDGRGDSAGPAVYRPAPARDAKETAHTPSGNQNCAGLFRPAGFSGD